MESQFKEEPPWRWLMYFALECLVAGGIGVLAIDYYLKYDHHGAVLGAVGASYLSMRSISGLIFATLLCTTSETSHR